MKTTRKKMLLSSIAMLLVALVALGSATYAWFSLNTTVQATGMSVTASAPKGLQITGTNGTVEDPVVSNYWGPRATFSGSENLGAVSLDYSKTTTGTAYDSIPATGGFYPAKVKDAKTAENAIYNGSNGTNFDSWTAAALPSSWVTTKGQEAKAKTGYFQAYSIGVRSTDDISSKTITATVTLNDTSSKEYTRVAVVDGERAFTGNIEAVVATGGESCDAISAITPSKEKQKTEDSGATFTFTGLDGAGKSTNTAKFFTILVWVEGQDAQCYDSNPSGVGTVNITFSYTP
jgi:hypothetical protein